MLEHKCEKYKEIMKFFYNNEKLSHFIYGIAIDSTMTNYGDSKYFWATNEEYASPILFCPYCGLDLTTLLEK